VRGWCSQNWQCNALDKDILNQGNRIYSPEYCRFIAPSLNKLLNAHGAARGDLPLGVHWDKTGKKYMAKISINSKRKYLGSFKTVEAAKSAYDDAKRAEIKRHAMLQADPEIKAGLLNWVVE